MINNNVQFLLVQSSEEGEGKKLVIYLCIKNHSGSEKDKDIERQNKKDRQFFCSKIRGHFLIKTFLLDHLLNKKERLVW
jgi:hypothetical protein